MSRRHQKEAIPPGGFVAMLVPTMKSEAWRAISHGARSLYLALKMHYSRKQQNSVYCSTRNAAKQLGANRTYIGRWFRELEHYGFIRQISPAYHGVGAGMAPHWRLTDEPYAGRQPTREFRDWNGQKFKSRGTRSGAALDPVVVPPPAPVVVPLPRPSGPACGAIAKTEGGPSGGAISSLPSRCGRLGSSKEREPAVGIGNNAGPPLEDGLDIPTFLRRGHPDCAAR